MKNITPTIIGAVLGGVAGYFWGWYGVVIGAGVLIAALSVYVLLIKWKAAR